MTAYLTVVTSKTCPTCKTCEPLVRKVSIDYPEVMVRFLDDSDPQVSRFHSRNLTQSVDTIEDLNLRQHYIDMGKSEISGLPTIFIMSDVQPLRILDMSIGCVDNQSSYDGKVKMMEDIEKLFQKVHKLDRELSLTSVGRNERRRHDYGL